MTQSPLSTPQPWDLVADDYTAEITPVFQLYAREALRLAEPPRGSRIVDVACGSGALALLAADDGHIVDALDFSPEMIARLRPHPALTARVGDGQELPYPDATFAAGFSMFGLMFFPDRVRGFAELRRVLVPGARAVISSWVPLDGAPSLAAMFSALRTAMAEVLGPDAPKPGSAPAPLSTPEACIAEMSASFADVEVHRVEHSRTHATVDAFWDSMQRTTAPLVLMRTNLGPDRWARLSSRVGELLGEALGPGPVVTVMPALLTVGTAR